MGQTAGDSRYSSGLSDLMGCAQHMPAAQFILEVKARGYDPVWVLDSLRVECFGLAE